MKLKKVLSLTLAGVLALSMLTACGGNSDESSSSDGDVGTLTASTGIVVDVQNLLADALSNDDAQKDLLPLAGSESDHVKFAENILNKLNAAGAIYGTAQTTAVSVKDLNGASLYAYGVYDKNNTRAYGSTAKNNTTYYIVLSLDANVTKSDLVKTIYSSIINLDAGAPLIDSMTVCGITVDYSVSAGDVVESYSLDSGEYTPGWNNYALVIFTTAKSGNK